MTWEETALKEVEAVRAILEQRRGLVTSLNAAAGGEITLEVLARIFALGCVESQLWQVEARLQRGIMPPVEPIDTTNL